MCFQPIDYSLRGAMMDNQSVSPDAVTPSLLSDLNGRRLKRTRECRKAFALGMGEWTDSSSSDGSADEAPKRKRLTLCKKLKQKENRWEFVNAAKEEALSLKFVPKNTSTNTKWALTNFTSWRDSRNTRFVGDSKNLVPSAILKTTDAAVLSRWFTLYAAETRKHDGSRYPPNPSTLCWQVSFAT